MPKLLGIVAVLLGLAVVGVWGWRWLSSPRAVSPQELAQAALTTGTSQERENAAVRLSQFGRPARDHLLQVLGESKQPEVRAACILGLHQQWDYRSMSLLLGLMDDESPLVRAQAGATVQNMLRVDYGFHADDPPRKRHEVVKRLRAWWETFQKSRRSQAFMRQQMGEWP